MGHLPGAPIGVIGCLCAAILRPFLDVIDWSSVIAVAFYPLHRRLLGKTRRPVLSPLLSTVLVPVTIVMLFFTLFAMFPVS